MTLTPYEIFLKENPDTNRAPCSNCGIRLAEDCGHGHSDTWEEFDCLHPDADDLTCDHCPHNWCSVCKQSRDFSCPPTPSRKVNKMPQFLKMREERGQTLDIALHQVYNKSTMNAELNLLLKNTKIGSNGERISFLHCSAAHDSKPGLLNVLPTGGHIFVNVFEGFQLLRLGEVLYSPDILAAVSQLSGGPGFEVNVSRLRKALEGNDEAIQLPTG